MSGNTRPEKRRAVRDQATGQFAYDGNWDRLCVCGHKLGAHCAGGFDCFNGEDIEYATGEPCDCRKFRLSALSEYAGTDSNYLAFAAITEATGLARKIVRRACRSLARKQLAEYANALSDGDGEFRGSGYAATHAGAVLAFKWQHAKDEEAVAAWLDNQRQVPLAAAEKASTP